jgi:hypothetical protein
LDDENRSGHHEQQEQGKKREDCDGAHPMGDDSGLMSRSITFITRQGCTLCDEALPGIEGWVERFGLEMTVVDVDLDLALLERFDHKVPVVLSDEGEILLWGRWGSLREARMMLRARYG